MTYYILDVFAKTRYSGNQLAVFLAPGDLSSSEMQKIAREINFSETTFITSPTRRAGGYDVRIFTPEEELPFAGHPTLGTAFILDKYIDDNPSSEIILNLPVGPIRVKRRDDVYRMSQNQPEYGKTYDISYLSEILELGEEAFDHQFPIEEVSTGLPFTIVPLKNMLHIKSSIVNRSAYKRFIEKAWGKGIMVFCRDGYEPHHSLSSRVFVEYAGIPEDPATGSATGCLAAYLLKHNVFKSKDIELTVGQGYEINRPSELFIQASLKDYDYQINIGGKVIQIAEGKWIRED